MIRLLITITLTILLSACSRTPDNVLSKKQMADLILDIHRGESIIDMNSKEYATDSAKQLMKQSVLARHNVSQQQLDSSFMWYGHHLEDYMEVYDLVAERLESELREMEIAGTDDNGQIELAGDSIDVWSTMRSHRFSPLQPSDNLHFTLRRDNHWEKGDIYRWNFRLPSSPINTFTWTMSAEYPDNTVTYASGRVSGTGWQSITFPTDTTQLPRVIHGSIEYEPLPSSPSLTTDSLSLTRMRIGHRSVSETQPLSRYHMVR